jgi:hypothetical protein
MSLRAFSSSELNNVHFSSNFRPRSARLVLVTAYTSRRAIHMMPRQAGCDGQHKIPDEARRIAANIAKLLWMPIT